MADQNEHTKRPAARRNSIEHEIMRNKLMEWRARKGLPVLGKYEEESQKKAAADSTRKHITTCYSSKRKRCQQSQAERKPERSAGFKSKQLKICDQNKPCSSSTRGSNAARKQAGRRSLVPPTKAAVARQPTSTAEQGVRLHVHKEETDAPPSTLMPLADRTNEPAVPVSSQEGSMTESARSPMHVAKTPHHHGRKSVRFTSPQESGGASVQLLPNATSNPTMAADNTRDDTGKIGMRERLEQWLVAKGKTPSRFRNLLGYESSLTQPRTWNRPKRASGTPHPALPGRGRRSAGGTPGDRGSMQAGGEPISIAMTECLIMLEEGCPMSYISSWLDRMVIKIPLIQKSATYWLCRARIAESESGHQSAMECLFEAAEFGAEPSKEVQEALAVYRLNLRLTSEESQRAVEIRNRSDPYETGVLSPVRCSPCLLPQQTPVARLQFEDEDGNQSDAEEETGGGSSAGDASHLSIKYSLKETTPYFARIHCTPGAAPPTTPCLMVTPVRRSARLDHKRRSEVVVTLGQRPQQSPAPADRRDGCLDSVQDVVNAFPAAQLILRPNRAIAAEFAEAELLLK